MQPKPLFFYRLIKDKSAFAESIGISQGYFSLLMNGKRTGGLDVLNRICRKSKKFLKLEDFVQKPEVGK